MRLDKWLWAVRLFKTRSAATAACRSGTVRVDGQRAKPSAAVQPGQTLVVRRGPQVRTVRVEALLAKRVGAKEVSAYATDLTPSEELAPVAPTSSPAPGSLFQRPRGSGRPTKKDRRDIESLLGPGGGETGS